MRSRMSMKKTLAAALAAAAVALAGCGDVGENTGGKESSAGAGSTETSVTSAAAETSSSATTTATTTAQPTETAPAETSVTEAVSSDNIGGEGSYEDNVQSMLKWFCGDWRFDGEQFGSPEEAEYGYLTYTISADKTFSCANADGVVMSTGKLVPSEEGEPLCFYLKYDNAPEDADTQYICPSNGLGLTGRADMVNVTRDVTYRGYYIGDIEPVFAGGAYDETDILMEGIDGEQYSRMNRVSLKAKRPVTELRLLALELISVGENGEAFFDSREICCLPALAEGNSFIVPMDFPGDMPTNGFSYIDENGALRKFSINLSGRDGSFEIQPIVSV